MGALIHVFLLALLGGAAYAVSGFLTFRSIAFAERRGLLAHANERSSHTRPTPRVGGVGFVWAIVPIFALFLVLYPWMQVAILNITPETADPTRWLESAGLLGAVALAFVLGFIDDQGKLPTWAKLLGQIVIALGAVGCGLWPRVIDLPFAPPWEVSQPVGQLLAALFIVAMMNAVNFMDGINGLAGRFAELFGFWLVGVTFNADWVFENATLGALIIGSALGFLRYNSPVASTFLGDCGSQAMGALVACAILFLAADFAPGLSGETVVYQARFLPGLLAVSPFLFDVGYTLVRRLARGENIVQAHRQHLYQRHLIARGEDHQATLAFVGMILTITCVLTFIDLRLNPGNDVVQLVLWLGVIGTLVAYAIMVRNTENAAGITPPPPQPRTPKPKAPPPPKDDLAGQPSGVTMPD